MADNINEAVAQQEGKTYEKYCLDNYIVWKNAQLALSQNKSYSITNGQSSSRNLTRADLDEVMAAMRYWEDEWKKAKGKAPSYKPQFNTVFTQGYPCQN